MAGPTFILGPGGKLMLVGGRSLTGASTPQAPTTSITLTDWYKQEIAGFTSRFNIQTTAASNDTTGDVPFIFSYVGGKPASVMARVVDGAGAPVVDWADISASVQFSNGVAIGYLSGVPAGIDYRRELKVNALTDRDRVRFNVGWNLLPWGQSNQVGTLQGNINGGDPVPGTAFTELSFFNSNGTAAFFGPYGFVPAGTNQVGIGDYSPVYAGGQALARLTGTSLQNKFGRKVGVAVNPWANNGKSLSFFVDATGHSVMLDNTGTVPGSMGFSSPYQIIKGDYRIVSYHQGETEDTRLTRVVRVADLKRFCKAHIDHVYLNFGRPANKLTFLFALMGVGSPQQMEILRGAVLDLIADPEVIAAGWDVRIGWSCIDLDPNVGGDGLHFAGVNLKKSLFRQTQGYMHAIDPVGVPIGAEGPRLTGAYTRSGTDVTLTVFDPSNTGLAAADSNIPITGWYAHTNKDFDDALGTVLPVSNVTILSDTQIRVTVAGATGTFYIKHCGGKYYTAQSYHPDVSNLIYNKFRYPTGANAAEQFVGLPLQPTPDAITVT